MFRLKAYLLLSVCLFCFLISIKSQNSIENILAKLITTNNDTAKINLFIEAGDIYKNKNSDTALFFYKNAIKQAELINNNKGTFLLAFCIDKIGMYYYGKAEYNNALNYYKKALEKFNLLNDTLNIAKQNLSIGGVYYNIGKYDKSLHYIYEASRSFEKLNDKIGEARCCNNIGLIYKEHKNYQKALESFFKAMLIYENLNNTKGLAVTFNNIGIIYARENETNKALYYYNKSLKAYKEISDYSGMADCYNNIGIVYSNLIFDYKTNKNKIREYYSKAHNSFNKALKLREDAKNYYGVASVYVNLANLNNKIYNYEQAIYYADKTIAIANKYENLSLLNAAYANKAIASDSLQDYKQASKYYKLYKQISDSIFNIEKNKQLTELQIRFETDKKEREIENLQKEQQIQELEIERQKNLKSIFVLSGIIFLLIALFFYSLFYRKRKTNKILSETNYKLSKSEADLIKLNNTKDRFFSIIAHDLKSPLYSLKTSLSFFLENQNTFTKEELSKFTVSILKSVDSVGELLDNLLNWSMSETKKISYRPEDIELSEIVNETYKLLENKASQKNINIINNVNENIDIYADKNMLKFIFRNLITNAIKFTERGGEISIDVYTKNDFAEIIISDTGIGITAERLEKLFDVNEKISTTGTENEKGTGLGLILCKEFVEKNKGKIRVESEINVGSKFIFIIPLA